MHKTDCENLLAHYHQHKAAFPEPFRLRIHRALSWLKKAESLAVTGGGRSQEEADWDMAFIALWVAFNAAYAKDLAYISPSDRSSLRGFLQIVCGLDGKKQMYTLVWEKFSGNIRSLLDNRYVFQPFWDFHNGKISEEAWQTAFDEARKKANKALACQDTDTVLAVVFERLYTLRNQLVHGGATCGSSANRRQVLDGCRFLFSCMPVILQIMMDSPQHEEWGRPFYPFIRENG